MPFDPFRRLRSRPTLLSSSEDDTDESSPEQESPRIVHLPSLKNPRKSTELPKGLSDSALAFHPDRPSKKSSSKSGVASISAPFPVDTLDATPKQTLIRRVTSKLNISIPSRSGSHNLRSRPSARTLPSPIGPPLQGQGPRSHTAPITHPPTLPNSFVSRQHREAALRERGLLPPRRDLSEQEREADARLACSPSPVSVTFGGSTEAEQVKAGWLATNRSSESSDSDSGSPVPPFLYRTKSPSFLDADVRRSSESRSDHPPAGRPSFCSSIPPLSPTSHLEVLHEEPSEQGPISPLPLSPARLAVVISSPVDSASSPALVESPLSCTFSSHCPGSTLESQSQSSHHPVPEKDTIRSPVSRRRTSDSADRSRKVSGMSLSKMGTRSLSNLHRTITGSLKVPSSTTLSSADLSSPTTQAPRMAIDPTIHSIGSILRETRDIQDDESRRLCELAFLD